MRNIALECDPHAADVLRDSDPRTLCGSRKGGLQSRVTHRTDPFGNLNSGVCEDLPLSFERHHGNEQVGTGAELHGESNWLALNFVEVVANVAVGGDGGELTGRFAYLLE